MARLMLLLVLVALVFAGPGGARSSGGEPIGLSSRPAAAMPQRSPIAPAVLTNWGARAIRNFGAVDLRSAAAWGGDACDFVDGGVGNSTILSVAYYRTSRSAPWLYQPSWRYPYWGYPRFYGYGYYGSYYPFGSYYPYGYRYPYASFYRPYFPYGYGAWPSYGYGLGFRPVLYTPAFYPAVPAVYPGGWYW